MIVRIQLSVCFPVDKGKKKSYRFKFSKPRVSQSDSTVVDNQVMYVLENIMYQEMLKVLKVKQF